MNVDIILLEKLTEWKPKNGYVSIARLSIITCLKEIENTKEDNLHILDTAETVLFNSGAIYDTLKREDIEEDDYNHLLMFKGYFELVAMEIRIKENLKFVDYTKYFNNHYKPPVY